MIKNNPNENFEDADDLTSIIDSEKVQRTRNINHSAQNIRQPRPIGDNASAAAVSSGENYLNDDTVMQLLGEDDSDDSSTDYDGDGEENSLTGEPDGE